MRWEDEKGGKETRRGEIAGKGIKRLWNGAEEGEGRAAQRRQC